MNKLTAKQVRFCEEYLIDQNATQSCLRSGYSPKTAAAIGAENLTKPEIQAQIALLKSLQSDRLQIDADRVLQKYWEIVDFKLSDVCHFDGAKVTFKPFSEWNDRARCAVTSFKENKGEITEIRAESKLPALRALGLHFGLFSDLNIAIATLKTYGINLKKDAFDNWIIDK
ncbi:terminase small subunit [Chamaesiphon sp.]|uniref:terminase small subunit n=1 Tax=Chamaesiphon sp. TaxID=2814140 RepID=UPI0035930552